jgi:hypothetical protein
LHIAVLDFYMTHEWYTMAQGAHHTTYRAFYLDRATVKHLLSGTLRHGLRKQALLPPERAAIARRPVLFLQEGGHGDRLVLLDYSANKVFLFGGFRMYHDEDPACVEWASKRYWKPIADEFFWVIEGGQPPAIQMNWVQVRTCGFTSKVEHVLKLCQTSVDNGPRLAAVFHHILQHGWQAPRTLAHRSAPGTLMCEHLVRERILYQVLKNAPKCYRIWCMSDDRQSNSIVPPLEVVEDMKTGPWKFVRFREIALKLDAQRRIGCHSCVQRDDQCSQHDRLQSNRSTGRVDQNMGSSRPVRASRVGQAHVQLSVEAIPLYPADDHPPDELRSPGDGTDPDFDDYDTAPSLAHTANDLFLNTWSFDGYGKFMLETCWSTWVDRGYRLKPRFFSMFDNASPTQHIEHLLPITTPTVADDDDQVASTAPSSSSSWCTGSITSGSDSPVTHMAQILAPNRPNVFLGFQGMLDEAGITGHTTESRTVFVCGKTRDNEFFGFDPTKDAITISQRDITESLDLDSFIHVTHRLLFKGAMHLHLVPVFEHQAPFWKTNHVSVQVLSPPSEPGVLSQVERAYTLNQIPHTHFGQISQGAVLCNIYVFFPRMIQKDRKNRFMLNVVPKPVKELWFDHGIIPAAGEVFRDDFPGTTEYVPWSLEQMRLRTGERGGPKTLAASPEGLTHLQAVLRARILRHPELLQRFGSFFFVVDSRGIKVLSKQYALHTEPLIVLQDMFPFLDMNHMVDRRHGELLLDLGISYHPPPHSEPLVGLWKLAEVDNSYKVMGANAGKTHHTCTLECYGGRQAKIGKFRRNRTQLLYRSTYNLVFEIVRVGGCVEYLCADADAIRGNDKYTRGCEAWKTLFLQAASKSFGVREEVRGSAAAILDMFPVAHDKVSFTCMS